MVKDGVPTCPLQEPGVQTQPIPTVQFAVAEWLLEPNWAGTKVGPSPQPTYALRHGKAWPSLPSWPSKKKTPRRKKKTKHRILMGKDLEAALLKPPRTNFSWAPVRRVSVGRISLPGPQQRRADLLHRSGAAACICLPLAPRISALRQKPGNIRASEASSWSTLNMDQCSNG